MEKQLIQFAIHVLNLIIARAANDPIRRSQISQKIDAGQPLEMSDLGFLSDETDELLAQADNM